MKITPWYNGWTYLSEHVQRSSGCQHPWQYQPSESQPIAWSHTVPHKLRTWLSFGRPSRRKPWRHGRSRCSWCRAWWHCRRPRACTPRPTPYSAGCSGAGCARQSFAGLQGPWSRLCNQGPLVPHRNHRHLTASPECGWRFEAFWLEKEKMFIFKYLLKRLEMNQFPFIHFFRFYITNLNYNLLGQFGLVVY